MQLCLLVFTMNSSSKYLGFMIPGNYYSYDSSNLLTGMLITIFHSTLFHGNSP